MKYQHINNSEKISNNMMKQIMFVFVMLFLINFVNAADMTFKANVPVDLKVACENNGTLCSNAALCNLTVISNNGSVIVKDGPMTNQRSFFNYTVNYAEVGLYRCTMNCLDQGLGGVSNFEYEITSTGDTRNWILFLFLGFISLAILSMAFFSGNEYVMFIGSAILVLTGVYGTIYGIGNLYNVYTRMVGLSLIGLGTFFLIVSSLRAIAEISGDTIGGFGKGGDEYDYFNE
jgi:hypothetical protein